MGSPTDISGLVSLGFGETPAWHDESLTQIIAGRKTAAFAPLRDLGAGGEPMPKLGERFVILDGRGRPGAVIEETEIFLCMGHELSEDFLRECGAEDVATWKARQVDYIDRNGGWFENIELMCDRFRLVEVLPR